MFHRYSLGLNGRALAAGAAVASSLALVGMSAPAFAAATAGAAATPNTSVAAPTTGAATAAPATAGARHRRAAQNGNLKGAEQLVRQAVQVVDQMKKNPKVDNLLKKAKGVYIVPDFGQGALIVGARGGAGVVSIKQHGGWSEPAFYDFGAVSIGPQVGAAGGAVAFILMDQTAVDAFKSGNKVSLNAGAGLSIVNYSDKSQVSWGKGDIVMWSHSPGAYVGAKVSAADVNWDNGSNRAFYGPKADMTKILDGAVANRRGGALDRVLPS